MLQPLPGTLCLLLVCPFNIRMCVCVPIVNKVSFENSEASACASNVANKDITLWFFFTHLRALTKVGSRVSCNANEGRVGRFVNVRDVYKQRAEVS